MGEGKTPRSSETLRIHFHSLRVAHSRLSFFVLCLQRIVASSFHVAQTRLILLSSHSQLIAWYLMENHGILRPVS